MQAKTNAVIPLPNVNLTIIGFVAFTFVAYVAIGLSLAVLPVYIHQQLGFSTIVGGCVINLQNCSTFFLSLLSGYSCVK